MAAVNDLVIGALECSKPRPQYAYVAPFRNQAKLIAWEYLKHYAQPFLSDKPNESELSVKLAMLGLNPPVLAALGTKVTRIRQP